MSGALSRSRPSDRAPTGLAASRIDRGEGRTTVASILDDLDDNEAWRPALAVYYKAHCMFASAELLALGIPLNVGDLSEIAALRAAFEVAPR